MVMTAAFAAYAHLAPETPYVLGRKSKQSLWNLIITFLISILSFEPMVFTFRCWMRASPTTVRRAPWRSSPESRVATALSRCHSGRVLGQEQTLMRRLLRKCKISYIKFHWLNTLIYFFYFLFTTFNWYYLLKLVSCVIGRVTTEETVRPGP